MKMLSSQLRLSLQQSINVDSWTFGASYNTQLYQVRASGPKPDYILASSWTEKSLIE